MLSLLVVLLHQTATPKAVTLSRVFTAREKMSYAVQSHITLETRIHDVQTFLPQDFDMKYNFTAEVLEMKTDGIALIHYRRPTVTQIDGETYNSMPRTTNKKVNYDFVLTVSPINEILDKLDQTKTPVLLTTRAAQDQNNGLSDEVGQYISELYRLALFNGPVESSLDFAPKFPFSDVAPGDTWKRTAGYQPQTLKGRKGKNPVVQRLDYTYTYRGPKVVNGKTYQRVTADLNLNTDLATWANQYQTQGNDKNVSKLAKMPMHLKATIEFDLDPKTFDTVAARAYSQGGFEVYLSDAPNELYFASRLKGSTTLSLRSLTR